MGAESFFNENQRVINNGIMVGTGILRSLEVGDQK